MALLFLFLQGLDVRAGTAYFPTLVLTFDLESSMMNTEN